MVYGKQANIPNTMMASQRVTLLLCLLIVFTAVAHGATMVTEDKEKDLSYYTAASPPAWGTTGPDWIHTTEGSYVIYTRLFGGNDTSQGRLEVLRQHEYVWGTVCDDQFNNNDANAICRMLGFHRGFMDNTVADIGTGQIWLENLNCPAVIYNIRECMTSSWGSHDCSHYEDVRLQCYSETTTERWPDATTPDWEYPTTRGEMTTEHWPDATTPDWEYPTTRDDAIQCYSCYHSMDWPNEACRLSTDIPRETCHLGCETRLITANHTLRSLTRGCWYDRDDAEGCTVYDDRVSCDWHCQLGYCNDFPYPSPIITPLPTIEPTTSIPIDCFYCDYSPAFKDHLQCKTVNSQTPTRRCYSGFCSTTVTFTKDDHAVETIMRDCGLDIGQRFRSCTEYHSNILCQTLCNGHVCNNNPAWHFLLYVAP